MTNREHFREYVHAAESGILEQRQIADLLKVTSYDQASLLRFALRLQDLVQAQNPSWKLPYPIETILGTLYQTHHDTAQQVVERIRFAQWSRRYGVDGFDWQKYCNELVHLLSSNSVTEHAIRLLCEGDIPHRIDLASNMISVTLCGRELTHIAFRPLKNLIHSQVCMKTPAWKFKHSTAMWNVAGQTDSGPKSKNDDAVLFATFDKSETLIAVADGTSDSRDGGRSASIALAKLLLGLVATGSLLRAVEMAATAIRVDNHTNSLDGACTLVAMLLSDGECELVNLGDTRYLVGLSDGTFQASVVHKDKRMILGGEALGDIITSSGNRVYTIRECPRHRTCIISSVERFALTSDGAFVGCEDAVDLDYLKYILTAGILPTEASARVIQRALNAFTASEAKPDNVSVVCGMRCQK